MTKILKILFSIYFSFILLDANSQVVAPVVQGEKCGSAQLHNQQLQSNPNYALKMQQFETLVEQINNGSVPKAGTIYKVPVVVHVMSDGTSLTNVTDEQIRISIRTLNELYRKVLGTKGDGSGVDVELEFALAVRDPQGNCTSGINRINMTGNSTYMASGVFSSSAGISDASLKAIYNWDQTQYYNIWLVSEIDNNNGGSGIQGYAYFASSHGTSIDGAVILANNFKDVNSTTAAHEIGHALNLFHTFEGDGSGGTCPLNANCATDGDLVCDTPPHMRSVSNCNTAGTNSCDGNSSNLLFVRNYMDYSSDACQNMFTDGQRTRARAALTSQRASFLAENGNMSLVPPSAPTIDFSGSKTILCGTGQTVTFYDNSSCIPNTFLPTTNWAGITFLWTITNGVNTYTSTNQNPVITFANTGTFDVTLQITNGFGTFSFTKQGMVVVSVAPTSACTPTSSNTGNFGQTVTSVKFNTINNATSTAANTAYTNNACTINTIVAPGSTYPLIVGINAGSSAAEVFEAYIDYNNDGDFADAGESLGGGTTPTNSSNTVTLNVTIPAGAVQNTLLRMRIIGEAGSIIANERNCLTSYFISDVEDYGVFISNKVASVTIAAAPGTTITYGTNVTFTATPVNGGASPTYTWYKNNVLQSGFTTNTYSNNTLVQGDQIYCKMFSNLLNVVSSPATSNTLTMTVTGPPLTAFVGVDTLVCAGSTVQFTDLSQLAPTSWNWTFTGGTPASSTSQNPLITYNTPGTYSVTLTTSNGLGTGTTVTKTGYITVFTTPGAQCSAFTRTNTPIGNIGLTKVKLNTIDHTTAFNDAVYQSFTCTKKTQLNVSTSYTLNLSVSELNTQWIRVYIDYNNNNSFLDAGELIYTTNSAQGLVSTTFTTPAAPTLNTLLRMRVITDFSSSATAGPCKTPLSYGQVEDYGIIMRNNCTLPATPGAITGVTTTCANTTGLTYSVGLVAGATTYNWSLPAGATITAGTGTNSITVSMGSSSGTISVTAQNACGTSAASSQSVTVNPLNTIAAGTNTTTCINTAITTISLATTGATGATVTALPAGVTGTWSANVVTISGTPTASGTFNYTVTTTGGCPPATTTGTITVNPLNTVVAGVNRTTCINSVITTISLATTGATGATVTGLPAGVTGTWSANVVTISGTPTASGTFNYTVTTTGGCPPATTTGTITVNPLNTVVAGVNRTTCINSAITTISLATTGATGATVTGLPAGVTGTWSANTVTISGTPTASGTFNYTVTTTGGCPPATTTGTITVTPLNTIAAGTNTTTCINTAITAISLATTGATGATFTGLPAGVTGTWSANTVTISGIPTASGTFNYTVTTTGGCTPATTTGTITVNPLNTVVAGVNRTTCINSAITTISLATTGATGATVTGLPAGVTGTWSANVVTISGTPTASGTFNYTVTTTGGCPPATTTGTITVTPLNTVAAGTNTTTCINTAITAISLATTGATGATFTGLPAGVTGTWSANTVTISGTPTASGTFNYTVTTTGGCTPATTTGIITVNPLNTIVAGVNRTTCINTAITAISLATTGATGATFTGLPAGVTGTWSANTVTISGTPTASGTFNYTVTTTGGCPPATTAGTITVNPLNTVAAGVNRTTCINSAITSISLATTGATGATVTGLPAGVTGTWSANTVTISGTPTASGTFNYTVTTTGGCTPATTTGVITVNPANTAVLSSAVGTNNQSVCLNTPITTITYTTTGATGATFSGLPTGVSGVWSANVVTISGTPSVAGTFNYTVTLTGGCGTVTATGSIGVVVSNTNSLTSAVGTNAQTVCSGTAITNITYATTGATGATVTGLPAGVTGVWSANVITISGTPTAAGTFNYTVTLTGGCGVSSSTGSITVNPVPATPTISAGGATTFCAGGSVVLTSSSATGNMWSTGATTQSITVSTSGTYTVTVSNGSCSETSTGTTITVNPVPATPTISAGGATTFCDGGSVVLTSSSATGNTWSTGETTPSITVSTSGTYTVTVSNGSCSASSTGTTITVNPVPATPTISAGGATTFCDGGSVVLTSSSATGNTWSTGETTQSITVSTSGAYSVTVSNGSCAATSASIDVTSVSNPSTPTISAGGATTFCAGGSVVLTSSSATGNTWSTGETTQSITVSTAGIYNVTVGASGCSATSTGTLVAVNANPTVGFGAIPDVCVYSAPVTLNTGTPAGGSYSGTGVTSGMFDPNAAGAGTTTLTYSYTDGNGCSGNANTSVTVDACASLEETVVNAWSMYPNPTTSSIIVNWTGKAKTLKVYDNLGKLIIDLQPSLGVTTMVVDLSTVANGVYTVQFELDATTTQQQLIVNR